MSYIQTRALMSNLDFDQRKKVDSIVIAAV